MRQVRLSELPATVGLPPEDQIVLPVFIRWSDCAASRISFAELSKAIVDRVVESGKVHMTVTEKGFCFERA